MATSQRTLPPLEFLRGFEAAARHLSFTRAAGELFLTQSAVSRQIQALEAFVGMPLFERRHKALALTEAGQAYYRTVAAALDQLREGTRKLPDGRYFACADFKGADGHTYDLDVFMKQDLNGLTADEVTVHKQDGQPRYSWVQADGAWKRAPVSSR